MPTYDSRPRAPRPPHPARLPSGVVQHREGVQRCEACGGEVIVGRTVDGVLVALTVVLGERHICNTQGETS